VEGADVWLRAQSGDREPAASTLAEMAEVTALADSLDPLLTAAKGSKLRGIVADATAAGRNARP